jgi:peptidoglycan-associated lipoprotein
MSKKLLLITGVIFLSSCATTNIQELGDKFLDLINPSDSPAEVADLSEQVLVLSAESGGFTEEELETLSNDELIELAIEKGLEDILVLDADGNLQNRDEVIKALVESDESGGFTEEELEALSNDELIEIAKEKGLEDILLLDSDGNLLNRDQVIKALVESESLMEESATQELKSLSDDALIEIAQAKGMEDEIILDEDGNLQNRDELIEALVEGAAETKVAVAELEKAGGSFTIYFAYDDTEIDEAATRVIIEHANFMQNNPSVRLRLEGHADERGTREYNLALGENRALSVKEVLGLYNLEDRVVVVSYGEERPIAIEHNEEAWEKNRRVEFVYY